MRLSLLAGLLTASLLSVPGLKADSPDFSGHWQLDQTKSQRVEGQASSLNIQQNADTVQFTRVLHESNGKELTSHFTCQIGGKECDFDDYGQKAKVSLWYDGSTLVVLKTSSSGHDGTVEWQLKLAADGKTMNVQREDMGAGDKTEKLVYDKAENLAAR